MPRRLAWLVVYVATPIDVSELAQTIPLYALSTRVEVARQNKPQGECAIL